MRTWIWLIASLVPGAAFASDSLVVQPQANGEVRIYTEGTPGDGAPDTLSVLQPASSALTVMVSAAGPGRCEGSGIETGTLRLSMQLQHNNQKVACGEPFLLAATGEQRKIRLKIVNSSTNRDFSGLLRMNSGLRPRIGNVSFATQGGESVIYPLYLDLNSLRQEVIVISAAFDKASLQFGLVGPAQDALAFANLRVGKTQQSGSEALPYSVMFESTQLKDNRYRMRISPGEQFIPYQISVAGQEVQPGSSYHSQIPAGIGTSELLNVRFSLTGKALRGIPAGTRLLDTITAVVTPET